ncbi:uncharacterized protein BO80DRAFT_499170 [Aspergillus ibericus CBS 121593]|uniref:Uncharacterized protein n=1 Tax=Aspergillus ibericus CBS 121593 TaxID=1448316 RepID=A0A395HB88_9EURO|nr:hypothetical protein BO80DRAFT_499170 [Aspergillus ibericus CBS 121593]RAL04916.1 hypothetical protein BO80DRAFT_499170 [Aspergillus ibericus CBS 121593]
MKLSGTYIAVLAGSLSLLAPTLAAPIASESTALKPRANDADDFIAPIVYLVAKEGYEEPAKRSLLKRTDLEDLSDTMILVRVTASAAYAEDVAAADPDAVLGTASSV